MKPIIKWSGGKGDELDTIKKFIPEHYSLYIEPFVGGGALFFDLEPKNAVINDIHPELIHFYRQLKDGKGPEIFQKMPENDEEVYYRIRSAEYTDPVDRAMQFYYLRKTCYRGMLRYNKSGQFNIPFGRYKTVNSTDLLKDFSFLQGTMILNDDFEKIFERYGSNPDAFCFIDQPYDSTFTDYGYCTFGHPDQERLAKCFKESRMKCLMVVGATDYIRNLYSGYIVHEYPKKYRFKIHSGRVGDEINTTHLVISNYHNG